MPQAQYEETTLENLNSGRLVAIFDRELHNVLENIADENTPAEKTREIVLVIKIKPKKDRNKASFKVGGHSRLAAIEDSESTVSLLYDGTTVTAYNEPEPLQPELPEVGSVVQFPAVSGERK